MATSSIMSKPNSEITKHVNGFHHSPSPFTFTLSESTLKVNNHVILSEVPENITITTTALTTTETTIAGTFLGFKATEPQSRHVAPIGKLKNINFTSIFRFKVWWTTLWTGSNGQDLETETQFFLLQNSDLVPNSESDMVSKSDSGRPYVLLLPIIEGQFRASLQPGSNDNIDVCVESGSTLVTGSQYDAVVYIHAGSDPFKLVKETTRVVRSHLGTFKLLEEKTVPGIAEKFGWYTWDAFYLKVHPQGVYEGVKGLEEGGCPPGFVLIDDGWQSIAHDDDHETKEGVDRTKAGEQMPCRLTKFVENYKFRDYKGKGLGGFVKELKEGFESVEYVYVWHALCGYWGGIRPEVEGMPRAIVEKPKLSIGLEGTMEDLAVDKIVNNGVVLVPPNLVEKMYEGIHSHLENAGIDGVKVDVIHLLEMVCEKYGGRVDLAKEYYKALSSSVRKHFKGDGVIASMEHCNDFMLLGTEAISLGRVGDDFWCTDPYGDPNGTYWLQGCHMVHCAYNSLWMGNFIQPDWDMFQSTHPCAAFHAASRAISGGPIYVSDTVGNHNFDVLKTLALPDGTILRCEHYALPTKDCLFSDPLHDGKTMLKIWNLNKYTGVLGVFNCQGGGWFREIRSNKCAAEFSHLVSTKINIKDIEWNNGKNPISIEEVQTFALYFSQAKKLQLFSSSDTEEISLEPFNFELVTVSPITIFTPLIKVVIGYHSPLDYFLFTLFHRTIKLGFLQIGLTLGLLQFRKLVLKNMELRENEDDKDRLSDLPDCVLDHIMSFLNAKDVVQTCILSTRWEHIWKHLPTLTLTSSNFKTHKGFTEFVNQFMSLRDSSMVLNTLHFKLCGGWVEPDQLQTFLRSTTSHNVNRLRLSYDIPDYVYIPPSLFSFSSLTSLDICIPYPQNEQPLCISSTTLLNLSICMDYEACRKIFKKKIELSTPNLCTFAFIGKSSPYLKFYESSFSSIKQVSVDIEEPTDNLLALLIFNSLRKLVNIESLTVSLTILQALSSSHDLVKPKPPVWYNLKSLKVKLSQKYGYSSMKRRDFILIDFLLQNSPSAKVHITCRGDLKFFACNCHRN